MSQTLVESNRGVNEADEALQHGGLAIAESGRVIPKVLGELIDWPLWLSDTAGNVVRDVHDRASQMPADFGDYLVVGAV